MDLLSVLSDSLCGSFSDRYVHVSECAGVVAHRDSVSEFPGSGIYSAGGKYQDGRIYGDYADCSGSGPKGRTAYHHEAGDDIRFAAVVFYLQHVLYGVFNADFSHRVQHVPAWGESDSSDWTEYLFLCAGRNDERESQAGE